jgi:hypothetical protein
MSGIGDEMTTWGQVTLLLVALYDVLQEDTESLDVQIPTGDGRTQVVTVRHIPGSEPEEGWVAMESPVAKVDDVELERALARSEDLLVGGLSQRMGFVTVRHVAPLATLDAADLARPMVAVARAADDLEETLLGRDDL